MNASLGEKVFWTVIALSSIGAGAFGYERFKLIRPDLFGQPRGVGVPETERAARIAEYQQKGDALTRAATTARKPGAGERCENGVIVALAEDNSTPGAEVILENGRPVRCKIDDAAPPR